MSTGTTRTRETTGSKGGRSAQGAVNRNWKLAATADFQFSGFQLLFQDPSYSYPALVPPSAVGIVGAQAAELYAT